MTKTRIFLATILCIAAGITGACRSSGSGRSEATHPAADAAKSEARAVAFVSDAEQAIRDGDLERALNEFSKAIEVNPNMTSAHLGMADIYRMQSDYGHAEQHYARVARQEPRNFDAQYFHGLMLHLLDRLPDAIQAYIRALAVRPNDFRTNLNVATAYYQLDENAQALPYAKRAVEVNPQDGPARFNLGAIYAALNRHADAIREYQQAAEFMQLTPTLLLNLADSLAKLDRYEEMANTLTQAIKNEPSAIAFERLGFARFRMGQYGEAKAAFGTSLQMDKDYYPALNGAGVCNLNDWIRSGRLDQKAKDAGFAQLRRSLQLNRDQPQIVEILTRYGR
jgi:tetratricopeptide (TPR) repeat protein